MEPAPTDDTATNPWCEAHRRNVAALRQWADGAAPEDRELADEVFELLAASSLRALQAILDAEGGPTS